MIRSAESLPPNWDETELTRIVSGIVAVSPDEASATARSNPATFWNRLPARSTKAGRNQNVSVRTRRSRRLAAAGLSHARNSLTLFRRHPPSRRHELRGEFPERPVLDEAIGDRGPADARDGFLEGPRPIVA